MTIRSAHNTAHNNKKKYDCIFSMGEARFVPAVLKQTGLRKFSGPFDWIYGSTFKKRMELLINRFEHYFDQEDLQYVRHENLINTDIYLNTRTGLSYNYDFPKNGNFEKTYPSIREKYMRRINRVLEKIQNGKKTLIVYAELIHKNSPTQTGPVYKLLKQANSVHENKLDLLYIRHNPAFVRGEFKYVFADASLYFAEYFGENGNHANLKVEEEYIVQFTIRELLLQTLSHLY